MAKYIRIDRGLDINLFGVAHYSTSEDVPSNTYAINLDDFYGVTPKMLVQQGDTVKAGEALFYDKYQPQVHFVSPVSGEVVEITRGARRRIENIKILADTEQEYVVSEALDVDKSDATTIRNFLLSRGGWPFIKQRPYDSIADPDVIPKAIFISGYTTAPLAANVDYTLREKYRKMQVAIDALHKLTPGEIHVCMGASSFLPWDKLKRVTLHKVEGPHPAGLVGTQINKIDPLRKGEVVWTIAPQDLSLLGDLLFSGKFKAERVVAVAGSGVTSPKYYRTKIGTELSPLLEASGLKPGKFRIINGDVLTGTKTTPEDHLGYYNNTVTVIPEGDDYTFFGWNKPIFNKLSFTRALTFSWMLPGKKYYADTNTNGEHRAFVITGLYEEVFPLDIYPLQLLKACMVKDIDAMEQLGLYEVAPEDFALTEFVCISKQPHQQIIREGLDLLQKELG